MKTTIEIDDEPFRRSKAEAALRGQSLKELFTAALRAYLDETGTVYPERHHLPVIVVGEYRSRLPLVSRGEHFDEIAGLERLGW